AGEPVEQEPLAGVRFGESLLDHADGDLVGHEVARVHVFLRLLAEVRPLADVLPEDVAGGDLRDTEVRGDELSLCPLPRTWGSHQDQPHRRPRTTGGSPRSYATSAGSRSASRCRDPRRQG